MNHSLYIYSNIDYIITHIHNQKSSKKIDNRSRLDGKGFQISRVRHRLRTGVCARTRAARPLTCACSRVSASRTCGGERRARVVARDRRRRGRRRTTAVATPTREDTFRAAWREFFSDCDFLFRAPFKYTACAGVWPIERSIVISWICERKREMWRIRRRPWRDGEWPLRPRFFFLLLPVACACEASSRAASVPSSPSRSCRRFPTGKASFLIATDAVSDNESPACYPVVKEFPSRAASPPMTKNTRAVNR